VQGPVLLHAHHLLLPLPLLHLLLPLLVLQGQRIASQRNKASTSYLVQQGFNRCRQRRRDALPLKPICCTHRSKYWPSARSQSPVRGREHSS
jgi:hypothetical protein